MTGRRDTPIPLQAGRARRRRKTAAARPSRRTSDPTVQPEDAPEQRLAASLPIHFPRGSARSRDVLLHFEEGNRLLRERNYVAAAQQYRRALLTGGELAEVYNNLAIACHCQGFLHEARRAVERALAIQPKSPLYLHSAALIARDAKEPFRAREYLDLALSIAPRSPPHLQTRGRLLHSLGLYPEALADLSAALEADSSQPRLVFEVALAASKAGDSKRARDLFKGLTSQHPNDPEPYYYLGCIAVDMGDTDAARDYLEKAIALAPGHPEAAYQLARLYGGAEVRDKGDNRARAVRILETCIERNAGCDRRTSRALAQLHFLLASLHDDDPSGYERAAHEYKAGLEWNPEFHVAHNNLGAIYLATGDAERAIDHFVRALAQAPTDRNSCQNFAKALYHHGTQLQVDERIANLLLAAGRQSPITLAMVAGFLVDLAEKEVYQQIYERDHKIKNLLGLTGNKLRRTRAKLEGEPVAGELDEVLTVMRDAYDDMGAYLQAIRPRGSRVESVDLNAVLKRVARKAERSRPEDCEIELTLALALPSFAGDAPRIEEAVLNLVANSMEALQGAGRVSLATAWDPDRALVSLSVEDTGPGIPAAVRSSIFRPGFTTKSSGNGLGLSIVRRTVADCRGTVEVESVPGRATRFTLRFPLDVDPLPRGSGLSMEDAMTEDPSRLIVTELA